MKTESLARPELTVALMSEYRWYLMVHMTGFDCMNQRKGPLRGATYVINELDNIFGLEAGTPVCIEQSL